MRVDSYRVDGDKSDHVSLVRSIGDVPYDIRMCGAGY